MKNLVLLLVLFVTPWGAFANHEEAVKSAPEYAYGQSTKDLVKSMGKNLLRVSLSCPVSGLAVTSAAILETLPVYGGMAGSFAEIGLNDSYDVAPAFDYWEKTSAAAVTMGAVGSLITDLTSIGYKMIFDDHAQYDGELFKFTKESYVTTQALSKHFASTDGNCGKAGRSFAAAIQELIQRQK